MKQLIFNLEGKEYDMAIVPTDAKEHKLTLTLEKTEN